MYAISAPLFVVSGGQEYDNEMLEQLALVIGAAILATGLILGSGWMAERLTPMRLFILIFAIAAAWRALL